MPGTQRTASASSRPPNESEVQTLVAGLATYQQSDAEASGSFVKSPCGHLLDALSAIREDHDVVGW
jgi:hypothetical protein